MSAPAWYPNPDGTNSMRYWDGQQWTTVAPANAPTVATSNPLAAPTLAEREVTPEQKKSNRNWLIGIAATIAVLAVVGAVTNGGGEETPDEADAANHAPTSAAGVASTTVAAPATRPAATKVPAPPAQLPPVTKEAPSAVCLDAPSEYLDTINSSFIDGYYFGEVKAVRKGELWYIAGQVHRADGGIRSRDDLFVAKDMIVSPVSTTARNESALPDLRRVLDVSFTDNAAQAALDCARTY